ncbi:uncharacterized protein PHALS_01870 [Plasmopara halstedii]|uniref:Uncharacterized protein n=1 Tax=Plasmopara halstedii TaxID=4781 RepID=A0A0P1AX24_PLAHL|nr:uncharacterized protein PHALS_01870 [Plasmopara halstedii]CEG45584.1 hypothetical protein PHALS_01870 [Plasmopara halstedii]|eukprot:XP_024581953.1 hypothetical protein PHALS_01870 [Plasmopara halstedii]
MSSAKLKAECFDCRVQIAESNGRPTKIRDIRVPDNNIRTQRQKLLLNPKRIRIMSDTSQTKQSKAFRRSTKVVSVGRYVLQENGSMLETMNEYGKYRGTERIHTDVCFT